MQRPTCGKWMPIAKNTCRRLQGHKGPCRHRVWYCDGCSKPQTGQVASSARDTDGAPLAEFCFMCTREARRQEYKWSERHGL